MSRIRSKNTRPENAVAELLLRLDLEGERHAPDLTGRPDFVFREARIVIFVDGDFWHGWRFPQWRMRLSERWEKKIETTRSRDLRNHRRLRAAGWKVVRIWEHQIFGAPEIVALRLASVFVSKS